MENPLVDQYRVDQSPRAATRLMEAYYPLVYSVCRRYLRQQQDVEDAAQETFAKLLRYAGSIKIDAKAWLTTTAASTSIDLIRRQNAERRRRQNMAMLSTGILENRLVHEAIFGRLHEALLQLDNTSRDLLIGRFVRKLPLRVIAGQQSLAIGTISRKVTRALSELANVLRDMGVEPVDHLTLAEHFGDPANVLESDLTEQDGLRFAPDWGEAARSPLMAGPKNNPAQPCLPG